MCDVVREATRCDVKRVASHCAVHVYFLRALYFVMADVRYISQLIHLVLSLSPTPSLSHSFTHTHTHTHTHTYIIS